MSNNKKIKFTQKEKDLVAQVKAEWRNRVVGTQVKPVADVNQRINRLYELGGLKPPKLIIQVGSPHACMIAYNAIREAQKNPPKGPEAKGRKKKGSDGTDTATAEAVAFYNAVKDLNMEEVNPLFDVYAFAQPVEDHGDAYMSEWNVGGLVYDPDLVCIPTRQDFVRRMRDKSIMEKSIEEAARSERTMPTAMKCLSDSLGLALSEEESNNLGLSLLSGKELHHKYLAFHGGNNVDCIWAAYYDFMQRLGVIPQDNPTTEMLEYHKSGIWDLYCFADVAIYNTYPKFIKLDDRSRLHSTEGPCVEWEDGHRHYYLHGLRVEERWVENPETISGEEVLKSRNVEARRAMILLMGYETFLEKVKAKVRDTWVDGGGVKCELLEVPQEDDENIVLYRVECPSTGKKTVLRVPPDTRECKQAAAWGFQMPIDIYAPLVET